MLFRQLFDPASSTYTYLLGARATREAVLIDPVLDQLERDCALLDELGLELRYALDTHVHADHISAVGALRGRRGARAVVGGGVASCADVRVRHGDVLRVGSLAIAVLATPGHTDESVSYYVGDRVFTGDALLVRGNGRTDFQNGDPGQLYDSITRVLFALPDETLVYPAHDYRGFTASTIGEEKRWNERVAGKSREQFVALMRGLHLAMPKRIQEAVPANQACGAVPASATPVDTTLPPDRL